MAFFLSFAILAYKKNSFYSGHRGSKRASAASSADVLNRWPLLIGTPVSATDAWDSPPFTMDPAILRQAAQAVPAGKHSEATVLLNELGFKFNENGRMLGSLVWACPDRGAIRGS
jgi:hypothetical protein